MSLPWNCQRTEEMPADNRRGMDYSENGYILALDTAGDFGSIAVLKGEECLLELSWRSDASHSRTLLSVIQAGLRVIGLELRDMGLIAVNRGPGRWTGIRLGIATAKGLSTALNIPVRGVASLDAMAQRAALFACRPGDVIFPVLDARRSQLYIAGYEVKECATQMVFQQQEVSVPAEKVRTAVRYSAYSAVAPEYFRDSWPGIPVDSVVRVREGRCSNRIVLLGDGVSRVLPLFEEWNLPMDIVVCAPPASFLPGAVAVGYTALQDLKPGSKMQSDCTPLYIRPSDAEVNKKNNGIK